MFLITNQILIILQVILILFYTREQVNSIQLLYKYLFLSTYLYNYS